MITPPLKTPAYFSAIEDQHDDAVFTLLLTNLLQEVPRPGGI